ncbi:MAG: hypothetical protein U0841_32420 [Chloroflexia bacterium]
MAEKWWRTDWRRPSVRPDVLAREEAQRTAAEEWEARRTARLIDLITGWGALVVCALLTILVYGDALRFAFTFDDPLDLPRAEGRSVWSIFTSSEGYAYYRPIPFVIWKFLHAVQGRYSEFTLHGLTLACHALAAWLLYLLLRRLTGSHWGLLASVLFITYPFSYQAAFGAHTLFHPLMTAAILLSLLLYHIARTGERANGRTGERAYLYLTGSVLAALVALWTHESGVIIFPLILGLEALITLRAHWQPTAPDASSNASRPTLHVPRPSPVRPLARSPLRPSPWPLLHGAATVAFLITWRLVPKFDRPDPWTRASLLPNAKYFLQDVIWPVAALLNPLGRRFGFEPLRAVWPAIVLTLLALAAIYWLARRPWVPLIALVATGIVLFPAWLVLTWVYVEDAPRLLYPAAPAIVALWGLLPSLRFSHRVATIGWRVVALLLVGAITLQNLTFIDLRRDMWSEGTTLVHGVADAAAAHEGRPLLFLNVPAWFAPKQPEYPLGHVGLTALPGYVGLGRVTYIHRGIQPPIESRGYYPDLNGWKYDFNTHGGPASLDDFATLLRNVDATYLVEMLPTGARIRNVGDLHPNTADPRATGPRFGPGIVLTDSDILLVDRDLQADFTWDILAAVPGDVLPVLTIRDESGAVVAEWRKYPLADIAAPRLFKVGDRVHDRPLIPLPADLAGGTYAITLTWEGKDTRAPLPGLAANGTPLPPAGLPLGTFTLP